MPFALHVQLEDNGVVVGVRSLLGLSRFRLLVPRHVPNSLRAALQRDQAQTVGQHLVLDDGGVLEDVNIFDSQGRQLGDQNTAESVGDGGIDADEGELGLELLVAVELDAEVLRLVSMCRRADYG